MIRSLITFLLIFSTLFCNAQKKKTDTSLRMLTYGMPDLEGDRLAETIAGKYGFTYFAVAGCSVTKALKDSVARVNKKVCKTLRRRLGYDWEKKYYDEVASIQQLQTQAKALVKKEPCVAEKMKLLHIDEYKGLFFIIDITDSPNVFEVGVFGSGDQVDDKVFNYNFIVDVATNTVTQKRDTHKVTGSD